MTTYRPEVFTINNVMYYFADDIKSYFPEVFNSKSIYGIIHDKKIKRTEYIHAYFTLDTWCVTIENHHLSKVMVSKEWLDSIFMKHDITVNRLLSYVEPKEIILENTEKFADADHNVFNIRVVGDKNRENIFFNMDDIINLNNDMIIYNDSITYNKTERRTRLFYRRINPNEPLTLSYYFTYYGIVAFLSKGYTIPLLKRRIRDWVDSVLLTEDTDVDSQLFKSTCNSLNSTSAVYLLKLGSVQDLRPKFQISNDDIHNESIILKHGKTYDIKSEFIFHYNYYKRYWHCDAKLIKYDEFNQYNSYNTESLLLDFRKQGVVVNCSAYVLGNTELIAVNYSQLTNVHNRFSIDLSEIHTSIGGEKLIEEEEEKLIEEEEEKLIEEEEEEKEGEKDDIIQKTKTVNENDNSIFMCIIEWLENPFNTFCC